MHPSPFETPGFLARVKTAFLIIVLTLSSLVFAGEEKERNLPEGLKAQEGLYKNWVPEAINLLKIDGDEKRILTALTANYRALPLLAAMGYLQCVEYTEFGSFKGPNDKEAKPFFSDQGISRMQHMRLRLMKTFQFSSSGREMRLYVFAGFTGWPGLNNTCIVLTSANDDSLIDWKLNEQEDMFESAVLDEVSGTLRLSGKSRRRQGIFDYIFDVGKSSIRASGYVRLPDKPRQPVDEKPPKANQPLSQGTENKAFQAGVPKILFTPRHVSADFVYQGACMTVRVAPTELFIQKDRGPDTIQLLLNYELAGDFVATMVVEFATGEELGVNFGGGTPVPYFGFRSSNASKECSFLLETDHPKGKRYPIVIKRESGMVSATFDNHAVQGGNNKLPEPGYLYFLMNDVSRVRLHYVRLESPQGEVLVECGVPNAVEGK